MTTSQKETQPVYTPSPWKGYLLIPHELLHVAGFRLVGCKTDYEWGQPYVTPHPPAHQPLSLKARLVGILFPFVTFFVTFITVGIITGLAAEQVVRYNRLAPFIFWLGLTFIITLYLGTTLTDLRKAYLLLTDKPWHSKTPLDLFFWPVVDWSDIQEYIKEEKKGDVEEPEPAKMESKRLKDVQQS